MNWLKSSLLSLLFLATVLSAAPITRYVSSRGNNTSPYTSLATAALTIQAAISASSDGDLILVDNGTYELTSNITVAKGITIRSINGPAVTIIDGKNVTRCLLIDNVNAVVDGFTITRGYNPSALDYGFGGGVRIASGGTLQNCIVMNSQARDGGGVAIDSDGLVLNCIVKGNKADNNNQQGYGGGVRMLSGGITRGCLVYGNTSVGLGGGINIWDRGTIQNCTVVNNTGPNGAGIRCRGYSLMENTISFFNNGTDLVIDGSNCTFSNNCTTPAIEPGPGRKDNISINPFFVNAAGNNYKLAYNSQCIDAGLNSTWMTGAKDLNGINRINYGTVDIGAYEFLIPVSGFATLNHPASQGMVYVFQPLKTSWDIGQPVGSFTFYVQLLKQSSISGTSPTTADWNNWYRTTTMNAGNQLSFNWYGIRGGTKYWWRVLTFNGPEIYSISDAQWFTTSGGAALANAIPSWPKGGALTYTNSPNFSWYTTSGDLSGIMFDLVIDDENTFTNTPTSPTYVYQTFDLSFNIPGVLKPGTLYYWKIITSYLYGSTEVQYATSSVETFRTNGAGTVLKPIVSYPVNIMVYNQSPIFYWYLGAAASGITYTLYIDGTCTDPGVTDQFSLTTSRILAPGTHTCYVRASNGIAGQEVNSDPKTFTIAGGIAQGVPTAWWPKGNPVVYTNTPTLNWTVAGSTIGLTKFRVAWSTTPSPDWSTLPSTNYSDITDVTQRSFILPAQAYGAHIYWAIAAYAGSTPSAWSAGDFTITGGTGTIVPIVSYPTGGTTVYSTSTSLSWYISGSSIGIQSYKVEYGNRSDFSDATIVNSSSSTTTISNLTPGATYYWRVSAYNGTSYSAPSNPVGRFTVIGGSGSVVPFAGSPVEGVVLTSASPELSWLLPAKTDANLKYELQYSTDNEMTSPVTISEIQQTSVTVSGLQAGTEYYWRVRSVDEKGNYSSYSAPGRFTVTATTDVTVDNAIPTEYKIDQNYPNPFNPSTMITYWLPKNSFVKLQVFDMLGREIKTLIAGQMNAGKHTAQWNADDNSGQKVSSGMYLYRLSTNETVITRKMILLR